MKKKIDRPDQNTRKSVAELRQIEIRPQSSSNIFLA